MRCAFSIFIHPCNLAVADDCRTEGVRATQETIADRVKKRKIQKKDNTCLKTIGTSPVAFYACVSPIHLKIQIICSSTQIYFTQIKKFDCCHYQINLQYTKSQLLLRLLEV